MAYFTKSGKRLFTVEQVQAYFDNSFWTEYNMVKEDDPNEGAGARLAGWGAFHLAGERISSKAYINHLTAEQINKVAEDKGKKPSEVKQWRGGQSNDRRITKQNIDFMERLDSMEIGDGSTSHDQAFDNKEVVA